MDAIRTLKEFVENLEPSETPFLAPVSPVRPEWAREYVYQEADPFWDLYEDHKAILDSIRPDQGECDDDDDCEGFYRPSEGMRKLEAFTRRLYSLGKVRVRNPTYDPVRAKTWELENTTTWGEE
jgi:hypothetical protein